MCLGRAPCDSIQEDQASGLFSYPWYYLPPNLGRSPLSPSRSPFPKDKTDHRTVGP
jgi:hypothetical protein